MKIRERLRQMVAADEPEQPQDMGYYAHDKPFITHLRSLEREQAMELALGYALAAAAQIRSSRGARFGRSWWVSQPWLANHPALRQAQIAAEELLPDGPSPEVKRDMAGWFRDL